MSGTTAEEGLNEITAKRKIEDTERIYRLTELVSLSENIAEVVPEACWL